MNGEQTQVEHKSTETHLRAESDPANELERQLAIVYCRLNTWCHPLTGAPMSREEMEYVRGRLWLITHAQRLAPEQVNQRLWMKGHVAWTNDPQEATDGR